VGQITSEVESRVVGYRRDFHCYAEAAWTEFRTSSLVARRLATMGCDVQIGRQVLE
jgi:aminobenzoyl-glutamate utilization protein A